MFETRTEGTTKPGGLPSPAAQGVDMKTAATPMTATRPRDLDDLQDAELLIMIQSMPHGSAMRDARLHDQTAHVVCRSDPACG